MILRSKEITTGAGEILGERINRGAGYGLEILGERINRGAGYGLEILAGRANIGGVNVIIWPKN